ncbi:MAG: sulfurtransferase complex subunit TusB [Gammaproteobacteria bacterium]|nr:sulfurtransferase complex subunit TusB [Gammaproteobacteria bacterium]
MLHTVNKSPFEKNSLRTCLRLAKRGSDILLIQDAVYAALSATEWTEMMMDAVNEHRIYVLEPDLAARGLSRDRLIQGVKTVGYDGFVELACRNDPVQSWL